MMILIRYAFILALVASKAGVAHSKASTALSPDEAVAAATTPLHRKIEALKEEIDVMEARQDTLEAATEQFRTKAKTLKDKLEEERVRYDILMTSSSTIEKNLQREVTRLEERLRKSEESLLNKTFSEKQLETNVKLLTKKLADTETSLSESVVRESNFQAEIETLTQKLEELTDREASLQHSLDLTVAESDEKEQEHKKELRSKTYEIDVANEKITQLDAVKTKLSTSLKGKEEALKELQEKHAATTQDLSEAKKRIRNLENSVSFWFVSRVVENEIWSKIGRSLRNYWRWLLRESIPSLKFWPKFVCQTINDFAFTLLDATNRSYKTIAKSQTLHNIKGAGTSTVATVSSVGVNGFNKAWTSVNEELTSWLEYFADLWMQQCTKTDCPNWLKEKISFLKAQSNSIIVGAEVLFALLFVDFAISTICLRFGLRKNHQSGSARIASQMSLLRQSGLFARKTPFVDAISNWEKRDGVTEFDEPNQNW